MSFQAMTWAVEQDLPALQKLVLLMLANCCNAHTGRCDPSHDRLAKECGMSRDSVRRAIAELEKCGLIEIRRQTQNGVNLPNQYVLRVGASMGGVGAESTDGYVHTAPTVGAHSTGGRCSQQGGVGADSTIKQEVKPGSKPTRSCDSKFDEAWQQYPKRDGSNSKQAAQRAWNARIREGIDPGVLVAAVVAYAAAMKAAGNVGTPYVKQASTFFGRDRHFEEFAKPGAKGDLFAGDGEAVPWWKAAGFTYLWQATNAGCSERTAHLWANGVRQGARA
ncbi:helix-turn-helix domain-containing protein [Burkholderia vietnamiensis]|uniref:helix-turn-helix domain-containing protein n=1 Tax=Burkholderia vietnamiensis TaxID=60552 RepID=UPI001B9DC762|nr:helix-turn-helix domain-containing protein [Burkholderia vietnamiensis]MBR8165896.1 helix-turn-helix domain-containing protein [Burkholderia vietnamiensis]MCA8147959.1 helix-turn-helix domain-containing protein [Burkholderia vietnamiensis]